MKITIKEQLLNIALISTLHIVSCKNTASIVQKIISTDSLQNLTFVDDEADLGVKILKTYPIQNDCTTNEQFASLYICKRLKNSDTVYVFDECTRPPDFAIDTSIDIEANIDIQKSRTSHPQKIIIFTPKGFRIPKNAKYIFAGLIGVTDD